MGLKKFFSNLFMSKEQKEIRTIVEKKGSEVRGEFTLVGEEDHIPVYERVQLDKDKGFIDVTALTVLTPRRKEYVRQIDATRTGVTRSLWVKHAKDPESKKTYAEERAEAIAGADKKRDDAIAEADRLLADTTAARKSNKTRLTKFYKVFRGSLDDIMVTDPKTGKSLDGAVAFVSDFADSGKIAETYGSTSLQKYSSSVDVPVPVLAVYDLAKNGVIPSPEDMVTWNAIKGKKKGELSTADKQKRKEILAKFYTHRSKITDPAMQSFFDEVIGYTITSPTVYKPLTDESGKQRPGKFEAYSEPLCRAIADPAVAAELKEPMVITEVAIAHEADIVEQHKQRVAQITREHDQTVTRIEADFKGKVDAAVAATEAGEPGHIDEEGFKRDLALAEDFIADMMEDEGIKFINKNFGKAYAESLVETITHLQETIVENLQGFYASKYAGLVTTYSKPGHKAGEDFTSEFFLGEITIDGKKKTTYKYQPKPKNFLKTYGKEIREVAAIDARIRAVEAKIAGYTANAGETPSKAAQILIDSETKRLETLKRQKQTVIKSIEVQEEIAQIDNLLQQCKIDAYVKAEGARQKQLDAIEKERQTTLTGFKTRMSNIDSEMATALAALPGKEKTALADTIGAQERIVSTNDKTIKDHRTVIETIQKEIEVDKKGKIVEALQISLELAGYKPEQIKEVVDKLEKSGSKLSLEEFREKTLQTYVEVVDPRAKTRVAGEGGKYKKTSRDTRSELVSTTGLEDLIDSSIADYEATDDHQARLAHIDAIEHGGKYVGADKVIVEIAPADSIDGLTTASEAAREKIKGLKDGTVTVEDIDYTKVQQLNEKGEPVFDTTTGEPVMIVLDTEEKIKAYYALRREKVRSEQATYETEHQRRIDNINDTCQEAIDHAKQQDVINRVTATRSMLARLESLRENASSASFDNEFEYGKASIEAIDAKIKECKSLIEVLDKQADELGLVTVKDEEGNVIGYDRKPVTPVAPAVVEEEVITPVVVEEEVHEDGVVAPKPGVVVSEDGPRVVVEEDGAHVDPARVVTAAPVGVAPVAVEEDGPRADPARVVTAAPVGVAPAAVEEEVVEEEVVEEELAPPAAKPVETPAAKPVDSADITVAKVTKYGGSAVSKELGKAIGKLQGSNLEAKLRADIAAGSVVAPPVETPVAPAEVEVSEKEIELATQAICGTLADSFAAELEAIKREKPTTERELKRDLLSKLMKEKIGDITPDQLTALGIDPPTLENKNGTLSIPKMTKYLRSQGIDVTYDLTVVRGSLNAVEHPDTLEKPVTYEEALTALHDRTGAFKKGEEEGSLIPPENTEDYSLRNAILHVYGDGIFDEKTLREAAVELVKAAKAKGIDLTTAKPEEIKALAGTTVFTATGKTLGEAVTGRVQEQVAAAGMVPKKPVAGAGAGGKK